MRNKKQKSKTLSTDEIKKLLEEAGFIFPTPTKLKQAKKLYEGPTMIYPEGAKKGIKI